MTPTAPPFSVQPQAGQQAQQQVQPNQLLLQPQAGGALQSIANQPTLFTSSTSAQSGANQNPRVIVLNVVAPPQADGGRALEPQMAQMLQVQDPGAFQSANYSLQLAPNSSQPVVVQMPQQQPQHQQQQHQHQHHQALLQQQGTGPVHVLIQQAPDAQHTQNQANQAHNLLQPPSQQPVFVQQQQGLSQSQLPISIALVPPPGQPAQQQAQPVQLSESLHNQQAFMLNSSNHSFNQSLQATTSINTAMEHVQSWLNDAIPFPFEATAAPGTMGFQAAPHGFAPHHAFHSIPAQAVAAQQPPPNMQGIANQDRDANTVPVRNREEIMRTERMRGRKRRRQTKDLVMVLDKLVPNFRPAATGRRKQNVSLKTGRMIVDLLEDAVRDVQNHVLSTAPQQSPSLNPEEHTQPIAEGICRKGLMHSRAFGVVCVSLPSGTVTVWNSAMSHKYLPADRAKNRPLALLCSASSTATLQDLLVSRQPPANQYRNGLCFVQLKEPVTLRILNPSKAADSRAALTVTRNFKVSGLHFQKMESGDEHVYFMEDAAFKSKPSVRADNPPSKALQGEFCFEPSAEEGEGSPSEIVDEFRNNIKILTGYIDENALQEDNVKTENLRYHIQCVNLDGECPWYQLHWRARFPKSSGLQTTEWKLAISQPCDGVCYKLPGGKLGYIVSFVEDLELCQKQGLETLLVSFVDSSGSKGSACGSSTQASSGQASEDTSGSGSGSLAPSPVNMDTPYRILYRRCFFPKESEGSKLGGLSVYTTMDKSATQFPRASRWSLRKVEDGHSELGEGEQYKGQLRHLFRGLPFPGL